MIYFSYSPVLTRPAKRRGVALDVVILQLNVVVAGKSSHLCFIFSFVPNHLPHYLFACARFVNSNHTSHRIRTRGIVM